MKIFKKTVFFVIITLLLIVIGIFAVGQTSYRDAEGLSRANFFDSMLIYKTNNDYFDNVVMYYEINNNNNKVWHIPNVQTSETEIYPYKLSEGFIYNPSVWVPTGENYVFLNMTHQEYFDFILDYFKDEFSEEEIKYNLFISNPTTEQYNHITSVLSQRIIDEDPFTTIYNCKNISSIVNQETQNRYELFVNNCLAEKNIDLDLQRYNEFLNNLSEQYGYDVREPTIQELHDGVYGYPHQEDEQYIYYSDAINDCAYQYRQSIPTGVESYVDKINNYIENDLLDRNCVKIK